MHGLPLGIVSISENGGIEAVAFGSSLTAANLGVRFRAGFVYSMLSAGGYNLDRDDDREKSVAGAFHLGACLPVSRFYLDADAGYVYLDNGAFAEMGERDRTDRMALQGRAVLGFRITDSSRSSPGVARAISSMRTAPSGTASLNRCTWVASHTSFKAVNDGHGKRTGDTPSFFCPSTGGCEKKWNSTCIPCVKMVSGEHGYPE